MDETISSLLINENFGGIGSFENLAPGTSDNNKNHLHTFE
ncbi:hypothetical protein HNQ88_005206, partial [Aureibacter tunicatorum]|nr:hypothetical protein [Aureibacter tunicatorum]